MTDVSMKFHPRFVRSVIEGTKTSTLRRSLKGDIGDVFSVQDPFSKDYRFFMITGISVLDSIPFEKIYASEGFPHVGAFRDWVFSMGYEASPESPLYLHMFKALEGCPL